MSKIGLILGLSLFSTTSLAELNPESMAINCYNCHNPNPNIDSAIPSLQGLSAAQLEQALLNFKYQPSQATLMPRLAKAYSDAEIKALAEYLSRP